MAHKATTLQFVDEKPRYLFGLTVAQTAGLVLCWVAIKRWWPQLAHGLAPLVAVAALWLFFKWREGVRREPVLTQAAGWFARRLLGPARVTARRCIVLEVDGYTRDALTEEQQDIRLANRLQLLIAALGPGGSIQLIVTAQARDLATLLTHERQEMKPVGRALATLVDRDIERLRARGVRENDLHFYVVLYEPRGWRGLSVMAALLQPLARRVRPLSFLLDDLADEPLLDDLLAETRKQLATMGLSSWRVPSMVGDAAPVARGERAGVVRLDDGRYACSFPMLLPPGQTDPGYLDALITQPGPYRIALWAHGTDPQRERIRLSTRNRNTGLQLVQTAAGLGVGIGEKGAQFQETEDAMLRLRQPGQGILRAGVYVTAIGATPREARTRARRLLLVMKGPSVNAIPARGVFHQYPLALSTRPGQDAAKSVWRMDAETVANMYPFNRANPATAGGLDIGRTNRGERVTLDVGDQSLRNALCVIFGLSGMGKTTLVLKLCKEWLKRGRRVTVLDGTGHYRWLGQVAGAVTVRTAAELDAVPERVRMIIVTTEDEDDFPPALRAAVDRKYTSPDDALVIEEAWQLEYMEAAFWVNKKARRGRHKGGPIWWVTHDPEDLLSHKVITSMFSAAAMKVAFALDDKEGVASRLGPAMGLTPKEVDVVKALREGECYVMRHNKKEGSIVRGAVTVDLTPEEKWLFVNDPRYWQFARREQAIAEHGGDVFQAVLALADTVPYDDAEVPA